MEIEKLLKHNDYDIYNNPNMNKDKLKTIAEILSDNDFLDASKYLSIEKCSSKFCWENIVSIIDYMTFPRKTEGILLLLELLQDENWPVFESAVEVLVSFEKQDILPLIENCLNQANQEADDMWIVGIDILLKRMNVETRGL